MDTDQAEFEIPTFTLIKRLGEGAMGEVWLGEHKRNRRKAAIKVLRMKTGLTSEDAEKLFLREAEVLASFSHPNIVTIYENDKVGDVAYLAMEFLQGGTLLERMKRGPIAIGEAIGLVVQIASGLQAAHAAGVVHRDLKPANVMLRNETTAVLTDFGAVRLLDRSTIYGRDGSIVGTPVYMSPEQITGQALDGRSDIYALGVMFFELLTGDLPFPGVNPNEIAAQHVYAPIPKLPTELQALQPIVDKALAKFPPMRFADAAAFSNALRHCFLSEVALRRQIGFSPSSAWSSQLRALGFHLDLEAKSEARIAQGEYLASAASGRATASGPAHAAPPVSASEPPPRPAVAVAPPPITRSATVAPPTTTATSRSNSRVFVWFAVPTVLLLISVVAGVLFWPTPTRQDAASPPSPGPTNAAPPAVGPGAKRAVDVTHQLAEAQLALLDSLAAKYAVDSATYRPAIEQAIARGNQAVTQGDFAKAGEEFDAGVALIGSSRTRILTELEARFKHETDAALNAGKIKEAEVALAKAKEVAALRAKN